MLFQHAGELSEFAGLLSDLAVPVEECAGALPRPNELKGARLVVVCGNRLLESGAPNLNQWPRTIAVIDDSSRTLVSQLSRIGAAMVIRRPIHPRALRLLLLHEIYRGPERRGRQRTLIGYPIRLSSGLFRPHATLLDLSPGGARIELQNAPKVGTKIRILIGKELTKGKPIKLQAKVVRLIRSADSSSRGESEIGVAILDASKHAKVIKGILHRFALGPASWTSKMKAAGTGAATTPPTTATASETTPEPASRNLPPSHSRAAPAPSREVPNANETTAAPGQETSKAEDSAATLAEPTEEIVLDSETPTPSELPDPEPMELREPEEPEERRQETRIPYDQRVVALGEEAARILVGRDLSRGGMRIDETPSISVGDVLRVALHSGTQTEPIVIIARALRDDGDDGIVLSFDDLSPTQAEQLEEIMASGLAVHASAGEFQAPDTTNQSIVVAEMIETLSSHDSVEDNDQFDGFSPDSAEANIQSDEDIDAHLDSVFNTSESI